jgi:hypothetical protein
MTPGLRNLLIVIALVLLLALLLNVGMIRFG